MALEMLRPVCKRGGREQIAWFEADPDMDTLREDPRCIAMIEAAERRLGQLETAGAPA